MNEAPLDDSHDAEDHDVIVPTVSKTPVTCIFGEEGRANERKLSASLPQLLNLSTTSSISQSEVSLSGTNFEGKVRFFSLHFQVH